MPARAAHQRRSAPPAAWPDARSTGQI